MKFGNRMQFRDSTASKEALTFNFKNSNWQILQQLASFCVVYTLRDWLKKTAPLF